MLVALIVTAGGSGCKKKESPPTPPPVAAPAPPPTAATTPAAPVASSAAAAPAAPAPDAGAPVAAAPDAGAPPPVAPPPVVEAKRKSATATLVTHPKVTVATTGKLVKDGHVYLVTGPVTLPASAQLSGHPELAVKGTRHGVAVRTADATNPDGQRRLPGLSVRLVGAELPETLEVDLVDQTTTDEWRNDVVAPRHRLPVTIDGIAAAGDVADLEPRFFKSVHDQLQQQTLRESRFRNPFLTFAASRAGLLGGALNEPGRPGADRPTRKSEIGEMMSLYTGATSVEEALQADRGLLLREEKAAATIPIADVTGMPLPEHPWDKLIAATNKAPVVEPLAKHVPADVLYVHFTEIRSALLLLDDVDRWLTPVSSLLEWRSGHSRLAQRYEGELMVERSDIAKLLGHLAVGSFAIVAADPFVREGTEVGLVFQVKDKGLFDTAIGQYETKAKARYKDALTTTTVELQGLKVRVTATADKRVNQHRLDLPGDIVVITNGKRLIERFLDVPGKNRKALADSGDFRYFRTLWPYPEKATSDVEDGFVFISDAFVQAAVSPRAKILSARRLSAHADLAAVGHATMMYGWLEGKRPASLDEVVASKLLHKDELKHGDGGKIQWTFETGATSTTWGRVDAATPLDALPLEKVTAAEKTAYEQFKATYQSYWRTFIDPVGIRVKRSDKGVSLDAYVMPLIDRSGYNELVELVGSARISTSAPKGHVLWSAAIGRDAKLRRELDRMEGLGGIRDLKFKWIGDYVLLGGIDRPGGLESLLANNAVLHVEPTDPTEREKARDASRQWAQHVVKLPVYAGVEVKDRLGLAAVLTGLKAMVEVAAPGLVDWKQGEPHRDVPVSVITARPSGGRQFLDLTGLQIVYATAGDVFLVAFNVPTLHAAIDAILDKEMPQHRDGKNEGVQAGLSLIPSGSPSPLLEALLAVMETDAFAQLQAVLRDQHWLASGLPELPIERGRRDALALAYLGYVPESVLGPVAPCEGAAAVTCFKHAAYGTRFEPTVPESAPADASLTKLIRSLSALTFGIAFDGEGEARALHAKVGWQRTER